MTTNSDHKSSILLIYTGGTIGMKPDPETGVLAPFDFNGVYEEFPSLRTLPVELRVLHIPPIDSSNVTPALWVELAKLIKCNYDLYDGFVILHGTDTMSYTASALSFMLDNLNKAVVFTGSQIPIGVLRTDGRENLITAIEIAAARNQQGACMVPEVSIYFQNRLFRANRTTKHSAEELNAFRSDNYPPLAEVGVRIHYNLPYIYGGGDSSRGVAVQTQLDDRVAVVPLFPGIRADVFEAMLSIEGLKAVVLETYGAGNAPTADWFIESVSRAVARGVVVLNVTQCSGGSVSMALYETGKHLEATGVVSGSDITVEGALTKLMVLLGQNLEQNELREQLSRAIRGEISA